ncbi:MAG TPA: lasso RiPP family leader peptide-containing protein [Actinomycetota bacterium]|nr:lasso RiPP family leader peptide-containing protein [Actinomycetota bacterium]
MERRIVSYEAPAIIVLGSVRELTLGAGVDCDDGVIGSGVSVMGDCI